jgi:MoxR-like ATPase
MVNGDLLRQLFRSFASDDPSGFRAAAEAVIREERLKNHRLLADDLERILVNTNGRGTGVSSASLSRRELPKDRERGFALVDVAQFAHDWSRLVLPGRRVGELQRIADENRRQAVLAGAGLKPTQRVLFHGPPGSGKTLAAQVLASALDLPLVTVRFDAVVSSYLGETAANLRRVFDFVGQERFVVLFDEFDAIGKDRDNPLEHGELKRVVNSLLQLMDAFRGDSLLIAATNHEGLLDNAIWRRFEAVVSFPMPSRQDRVVLLHTFLRGFNTKGLRLESLARRLDGATGADIERVAVAAARQSVLDGRSALRLDDFAAAVTAFQDRRKLQAHLDGTTPNQPSLDEGD